jgi:hypothetical protein
MDSTPGTKQRPATLAEIRQMVGDVEAAKLESILATGATPRQSRRRWPGRPARAT